MKESISDKQIIKELKKRIKKEGSALVSKTYEDIYEAMNRPSDFNIHDEYRSQRIASKITASGKYKHSDVKPPHLNGSNHHWIIKNNDYKIEDATVVGRLLLKPIWLIVLSGVIGFILGRILPERKQSLETQQSHKTQTESIKLDTNGAKYK